MERSLESPKTYNVRTTSFTSLLTLVFITLKLTHFIAWSWWWVLSPTLIPIGLWLLVGMIFVLVMGGIGLVTLVSTHNQDKNRAFKTANNHLGLK